LVSLPIVAAGGIRLSQTHGEPASFDDILAMLAGLERRINQAGWPFSGFPT
jgi:hypothetical protein